MALDHKYQAMPEGCVLLERARHDADFGSDLEFFDNYLSATDAEFAAEARELVRLHPGLEKRNLWFGRRWDVLYYLLSENRRQNKPRDNSDWVVKAIFGGSILASSLSTVGHPIRYLIPSEVVHIAELFKTMSVESLRAHWNPRLMYERKVYKIHPEETDEDVKWTIEDFEKLKAFFVLVAQHNEGVLSFVV